MSESLVVILSCERCARKSRIDMLTDAPVDAAAVWFCPACQASHILPVIGLVRETRLVEDDNRPAENVTD